jgi:hypothetical protein
MIKPGRELPDPEAQPRDALRIKTSRLPAAGLLAALIYWFLRA